MKAAAAADLAEDDVAYLTQLGLVRGHLDVGMDLYRQGERAAAEPHMAHPPEELYQPLEPALAARGAPAFEEQLEELEHLVEQGASVDRVETAYRKALDGVSAAEAAVPEAVRAIPPSTSRSWSIWYARRPTNTPQRSMTMARS